MLLKQDEDEEIIEWSAVAAVDPIRYVLGKS
jgi:hypothetical protein